MAITRWEPFWGLRRWGPFREFLSLQKEMDRLFGQYFGRMRGPEEESLAAAWAPAVDIYETEDKVVLKAELPGLKKDHIDIQIRENTLTLKGEKKFEKEVKEENYHRVERTYGTFQRSFTLPNTVKQEGIEAIFKDGVLEVSLPKAEEAKPKKVAIKS
ncbi:MAG: Hsp20/alpha crystallin family protein [candidate division NC10 bacterium]|nr:Hsp20/alpha crystallin family protein [candidate division NC10 bacterium]